MHVYEEIEELIEEILSDLDEGILNKEKINELIDVLEEAGRLEYMEWIKSAMNGEDIEELESLLKDIISEMFSR